MMFVYQKTNEDITHEPFTMKRTNTMFINRLLINKLPNPEGTKGNEKIYLQLQNIDVVDL
jgi:hypothetical protein